MSDTEPDLKHYYRTAFLSQFNPLGFGHSLLQIFGQLLIRLRHSSGIPETKDFQQELAYMLPFEGAWLTVNGGSTMENSHSWEIYTQRYAYDFVRVDEDGESFSGEGTYLSDYYCYEQAILSPADGVVVRIRDGVRDYKGVGDYSVDWKTRDFRGNFVIIQHAPKEFSFLAHLKRNSLMVKKGDQVKKGQLIGLCGNSGNSTEPHLHFHLQDRANFWTAMGLPIRFEAFSAEVEEKKSLKAQDFVEKGEKVGNLEAK